MTTPFQSPTAHNEILKRTRVAVAATALSFVYDGTDVVIDTTPNEELVFYRLSADGDAEMVDLTAPARWVADGSDLELTPLDVDAVAAVWISDGAGGLTLSTNTTTGVAAGTFYESIGDDLHLVTPTTPRLRLALVGSNHLLY